MKYTAKMFNILTLCLAIYFFIFTGFLFVRDIKIEKDIATSITKLSEESRKLNEQWMLENKINGSNSENNNKDMVFKTASEVAIAATDVIMNAQSFEIIATGTISVNVSSLGMTVEPEASFVFSLYPNGDRYEEGLRFISGNDYGQKQGSRQIRKANGSEFVNKTTNVSKSGSKLVANFTQGFESTTELYFAPQFFYIVNKNTIKKETYFKYVELENGEVEYHSQIYLNPLSSTKQYAEYTYKQAKSTTVPVFSSICFTVVTDSKGYPKTLSIKESYVMSMQIPILGEIRTQNINKLNYTFFNINENLSTPLPTV